MPNLVPPVLNCTQANAYKERIEKALQHVRPSSGFKPLMVLYLTDQTSAADIKQATQEQSVVAAKLYPAGATTNSASGVTDIAKIYPVLEAMQRQGMPLLVHGEVTANDIDIFDREKIFIDSVLKKVASDFPVLKIVLEHITTKDAVDFVTAAADNVAATITAHHLLFNRNDLLVGGVKPHYFCLPVLKRSSHQQALLTAATSGNKKFFLGTDSAPHSVSAKENACGCAGCYTAHAALELYAEAFDGADALDRLEGFASFYGPDFYGLERNSDTVTLRKQQWLANTSIPYGDNVLRPIRDEVMLQWQVVEDGA